MSVLVPSLRREASHPSPVAHDIWHNFQGMDDPHKMVEMAARVRAYDRADGAMALGNGPNSPAIREGLTICIETLQSAEVSPETKIAVLDTCVPMMFSLVSGRFSNELSSLHAQVLQQKSSSDPELSTSAIAADRLIGLSAKPSRAIAALRGVADRPSSSEPVQPQA